MTTLNGKDNESCGPRPCPIPPTKRRLRNALWVCHYCGQVFVLAETVSYGEGIWYWRKVNLKVVEA